MKDIGSFEQELANLKLTNENGSFDYSNPDIPFCRIVTAHFHKIRRKDKHGIYIIRQKQTGKVLYIGKSGTINLKGRFKGQDIPRRLKNVKNSDIPANDWFKNLYNETGELVIEYVYLSEKPISPTLIESILLQAYYNEFNSLPIRNNSL